MPSGGGDRRFRNLAQHVLLEHFEHLRHADEHRDAALADLTHDVVRCVAARKDDHPFEHRRHEGRHGLAEHVAERQQIEKPDRLERTNVSPVLRHLAFDRHDVREDVAMCQHHALGLRRRTRREDDLGGGVGAQIGAAGIRNAGCGIRDSGRRHRLKQPVQTPDGSVGSERSGVHDVAGQDGLRIDDRRDLAKKVRRCPVVDRHDDHALDQRAPQRGDPLRPILAPDRDGLSVRDTARPQELRKRQRPPRHLPVRPPPRSIPVVVHQKV